MPDDTTRRGDSPLADADATRPGLTRAAADPLRPDALRTDPPRPDALRTDAPRLDAPRTEGGRPDAPKPDTPAGAPVGAGRNLLFLREEELRLAQDLLFFGYRDFTAGADALLVEFGFGRAHHRVLHFVGRRPGITVGELLAILGITKQSLARVLTPLVEEGYVLQATGRSDRRQRLLSLTPKGEALERRLFERQREWVMRAYREAGPVAVEGFRRVMRGLMGPEARTQLERLEQPEPRPGAARPAALVRTG